MNHFVKIYNEYEQTRNVCKFCEEYQDGDIATRFLLIRSLDKINLKDIIRRYSDYTLDGNIKDLTEKAYNSSATIDNIVSYIEEQRETLIAQREKELCGLQDVLSRIPIVNCGVRNDKVDDIVKSFVRNKKLKTIDALNQELNDNIMPRIRQYSLWSYYNQTANDIIELFLLKHPKVIPTLRKIHDIDFFLKIDDRIVPFDLKFTHISDSYFDLISQGVKRNTNCSRHDDFLTTSNESVSELKIIKSFYIEFKRRHRTLNLPNIGDYDKREIKNSLLQSLIDTGDSEAIDFALHIQETHKQYVPSSQDELNALEWWNYKFQGERLFCNNNRLFVFLAYKNRFTDGRELKGKTKEIKEKINILLDATEMSNIHTIKYHYDKAASFEGDYVALAISTIYSE